ncbi:DUF1345 domain-containing protein [Pseudonocardia phyllosphaerae]|uniref:DUF1345 domain-containing protein n=1 Tax=Pseudonocardia phyllosphaerae TaxID=3390502 RepID=UPI00397D2E65
MSAPEHTADTAAATWSGRAWLPERWRLAVSAGAGVVAFVFWHLFAERPDGSTARVADVVIVVLVVYLLTYLVVTSVTFAKAPAAAIRDWADRPRRGTFLQRYLLGTAPGPGVSIFVSTVSLIVAIGWLPQAGNHGTVLPPWARITLGVLMVIAAWWVVVVSFTVAYQADDVVDDRKGLQFAGPQEPTWSDYIYFGVGVQATFGATDVTAATPEIRRTVTLHGVLAFVFNTVTLGAVVGVLVP